MKILLANNSNLPGNPIPRPGLLFEPGNVDDQRAKIEMLMASPELAAKMGHNARQKAEREYGAQMHYERLMSVYGNVVKNNVMP